MRHHHDRLFYLSLSVFLVCAYLAEQLGRGQRHRHNVCFVALAVVSLISFVALGMIYDFRMWLFVMVPWAWCIGSLASTVLHRWKEESWKKNEDEGEGVVGGKRKR